MATCTFVNADSATQGAWAGVYGADGYNIVADSTSYPAYATVTPSGQSTFNWGGLTGISPYEASSPTTPNPNIWYGTVIDIDIVLTGGDHQLAFYYFQNDGNYRTLTVEVLDMDSGGAVLDTQVIGGMDSLRTAPVYLVWNCSGHVKIRTSVSGLNALLGAYFFDPVSVVATNLQETQEVVEYLARYQASVRGTQEVGEYAAQYGATIYDTQEVLEIIWQPTPMTAYVY